MDGQWNPDHDYQSLHRWTTPLISRVAQGTAAEDLALRYLEARGLSLVTRNFRCRSGELDLIMRDGEQLVFVEVRSRRHARYGTPAESVTRTKQQRLLRAAAFYLQRQHLDLPCRFDVVAILQPDGEPQIEWIRDAFQLN
ncbi:MAG: YraN family protein [Candidatus Contendobacter sp.]|nr:MAG: YraN family protein [Candidatus Contendobacter sp.]